jgi:hypothetical protein
VAARATEEALIDNELLDGMGRDDSSSSESDHSEIKEIMFATLISPPLLRVRSVHKLCKRHFRCQLALFCATASRHYITPSEACNTRCSDSKEEIIYTRLTHTREASRSPRRTHNALCLDFPRAYSCQLNTPRTSETSPTTAPARFDGRERRAGKNTVYLEVMAIKRGTGRGGRRGGRG